MFFFLLRCGSGCVTAYLARLLPGPAYFAVDINEHAVAASRRTFEANRVDVELVQTDLLQGLAGLRVRFLHIDSYVCVRVRAYICAHLCFETFEANSVDVGRLCETDYGRGS
jgi:hypothetical protein